MFWESGVYQFNEKTPQGQKLLSFRALSISSTLPTKILEETHGSLLWVIVEMCMRSGNQCVTPIPSEDPGHPSVHWPQGGPRPELLDTTPWILVMSLSTPVTVSSAQWVVAIHIMVWNSFLKYSFVPRWVLSEKLGLFCKLCAVSWRDKWLTNFTDNLSKRREQNNWWKSWCCSDNCVYVAGWKSALSLVGLEMLFAGITVQELSRC